MLSRLLTRSLRRTAVRAGAPTTAHTAAAVRAVAAGAVRRSGVAVGAARAAAVRSIATAAPLQQPASAKPAAAAAAASTAGASSSGGSAYPGAPTAGFTNAMEFVASHRVIPSYRVTDEHGVPQIAGYKLPMDGATLKELYAQMIVLRTMDGIFYDAQRQGRISFFMESKGEEAIHFGSAAALDLNDVVFAQYREAGVLLHRGFTLDDFANQCFSNALDLGKGRQMPVHYGSRRLNVQTISSPLSTQIPQASGAAYALKLQKDNKNCVICYFGEGAASEGDFHAALNFAATLDCPVVFFCRNNGFAISTPTKEQYRGDGIVARGPGYGIHSIRVDGNDLLAVYEVTRAARKMAVEQNKPVLIEAMTYRGGHHSTSDDSSRYRSADEIVLWTDGPANPLTRTRLLLEANGLWDAAQEDAHRKQAKRDVFDALKKAEAAKKPAASQLFTDVYDVEPHHIRRQRLELEAHLQKHGADYQLDGFEPEASYTNPAPKA